MYRITIYTLALLTPVISNAATPGTVTDFSSLVNLIVDILELLVIITFILTMLATIWGVVQHWIIEGGSAEGVESGKNYAVAGIIALVIMSSIWGIVYMLRYTLMPG